MEEHFTLKEKVLVYSEQKFAWQTVSLDAAEKRKSLLLQARSYPVTMLTQIFLLWERVVNDVASVKKRMKQILL